LASYKKKKFIVKHKKIRKKIGVKKIHIITAAILMICILAAVLFCIVYFLKNETTRHSVVTKNITTDNTTLENNMTISNVTLESNITTDNTTIDNQTTQSNHTVLVKPKLAIIIDDVTFERQLNDILSIPLKITPSFLPPTIKTNFSAKLAKRTEFHMVHLPLEAMSFKNPEEATLLVDDSYDIILQKLKMLKAQFPHAIYYNNHTGSKFTADFDAMERLLKAMDEVGLIFIDSRTTADTKAPKIAKKEGKRLLQRDVFLDNVIEKEAIKKQILLAISKAKERNFAIAIGHPHKETIAALKEFAKECDEVEVVYIKDL
jgi:polysaccharide deacetylase 2 family uncharacterized protein YibQ